MAKPGELTPKQKLFCEYYSYDWNGTQAAIKAGYSVDTAGSIASENLQKPEIQAYIQQLQEQLEKRCGISKAMIIEEAKKIAFSSVAHLHNSWITRKEFDELTDDQKSSICQIETQTRFEKNSDDKVEQIDYVKIKLHDKMKGIEVLNKMLGYNSEEKISLVPPVKSFKIVPASGGKRVTNE